MAPLILDLGTRWRWVVSFTPRPLYRQGKTPGTHWIGGWVGPRAVPDAVVKRKIPSPSRESKPRTPIFQLVARRYTDWAISGRNYSLRYRLQDGYPIGAEGFLWPKSDGDHSPPSSAEVKNAWSYTSTPPYVFTAWRLTKHRDNFI
jgi:hypothetical protein